MATHLQITQTILRCKCGAEPVFTRFSHRHSSDENHTVILKCNSCKKFAGYMANTSIIDAEHCAIAEWNRISQT